MSNVMWSTGSIAIFISSSTFIKSAIVATGSPDGEAYDV